MKLKPLLKSPLLIVMLIILFDVVAKIVNEFTEEIYWAGRLVILAVGIGIVAVTAKEMGII